MFLSFLLRVTQVDQPSGLWAGWIYSDMSSKHFKQHYCTETQHTTWCRCLKFNGTDPVEGADCLLASYVVFIVGKHLEPATQWGLGVVGYWSNKKDWCFVYQLRPVKHCRFGDLWPVMVHQHVDQILEEAGLAGTEEALRDLLDGLLQLGKTVVVGQSVVAVKRGDMKILWVLVDLMTFNIWAIKFLSFKRKLCIAKHGRILCHCRAIWLAPASR